MTSSVEEPVKYFKMYGLAVCDEAREEYSSREIKKLGQVAQKWFARNAILNNRKLSPRRFRPCPY